MPAMQYVVQRSSLDSPVRSSIFWFVPLYMQIKQAIKIWIARNVHSIRSGTLECIVAKRRGGHQWLHH